MFLQHSIQLLQGLKCKLEAKYFRSNKVAQQLTHVDTKINHTGVRNYVFYGPWHLSLGFFLCLSDLTLSTFLLERKALSFLPPPGEVTFGKSAIKPGSFCSASDRFDNDTLAHRA